MSDAALHRPAGADVHFQSLEATRGAFSNGWNRR